jgi:hypothetical protein
MVTFFTVCIAIPYYHNKTLQRAIRAVASVSRVSIEVVNKGAGCTAATLYDSTSGAVLGCDNTVELINTNRL